MLTVPFTHTLLTFITSGVFILVSVCITAVTFQVLDCIAEIRKQMIDGVSVYVIVEDYQLSSTDAGLEDAVFGK